MLQFEPFEKTQYTLPFASHIPPPQAILTEVFVGMILLGVPFGESLICGEEQLVIVTINEMHKAKIKPFFIQHPA
jgi:hypothetical protein